jgi:predicted aspartyl protease
MAQKIVVCLVISFLGLALHSAPDDASQLYSLFDHNQYLDLERRLPNAHLTNNDAAFFRGVLANRKNRIQESIQLLEPLAQALSSEPQSQQEMKTLQTLGDDFCKIFDYAKAEEAFSMVLLRSVDSLSRRERQNISERLEEMQIVRSAPPQTVERNGAFTVTASHNALGLLEIPVEANGHGESWVLDTGAGTSVVTETTARRIGVQVLEGTAHTRDISGLPVSYHIGILAQLKIGTAVLRNVELPVTSDTNLNLGHYQIQGIIGFPVQDSLGRITITPDHVGFNTDAESDAGSEMFMQEQMPIVSAQTDGATRLFSLDTGATGTILSIRFYRVAATKLAISKRRKMEINGAGGSHSVHGYDMKNLQFQIGGQRAVLPKASILAEPTESGLDDFFGNIGQDILRSFKSYTIDFGKMKFRADK